MGSPRAFELRRAELGGDAVRDAEVVASFRESVGPDGLLTEYIKHARLALILGNTLFVHGAVCERSAASHHPAQPHCISHCVSHRKQQHCCHYSCKQYIGARPGSNGWASHMGAEAACVEGAASG